MRLGSAALVAIALAASSAGACASAVPPRTHVTESTSSCRREPAATLPCTPTGAAAAPTYRDDVRPILERRCFKCHAGDGVAADDHDLSRLETLRAQRGVFARELRACAMPPSSEPPLPDAEAAVLLAWAACDGARGDDSPR